MDKQQAFGGDDSGNNPPPLPEKRKLDLGRYGLSPDVNIRDLFWRIMGAYAANKKPGIELKTLDNDRFALMRIALSIVSSAHSDGYGLAPRFIITYTIMMLLDGGWNDALVEFLERACERKLKIKAEVAQVLRKMLPHERYGKMIIEQFTTLMRSRSGTGVALEYIVDMDSVELVPSLKKELVILARGDIGQNQLNAIRALAPIKKEEDVKKSLIVLLSHWDVQARIAAAELLSDMGQDTEVKAAVEKRMMFENNEEMKGALRRIMTA